MPNDSKGEVEIKLGAEMVTLRPSFESMAEIENRSGFGIQGLAIKIMEQNVSTAIIAAVVYGGLIGAENTKYSFDDVKKLVFKTGYAKLLGPVMQFMANAMSPNPEEPEKKT